MARVFLPTVGVLAAVVVWVSGCSSGSGGDESLSSESEDEVVASATATSDPSATSVPSVTTEDTAPLSALTDEPTSGTTPDGKPLLEIPTEWDDEWAEVEGRYQLYWEAVSIANGPPAANPDYPPLAELAETEAYAELQGQLQSAADDGTIVVDPDPTYTQHYVTLPNPAILSKTEGNEVVIQDCYINGLIVMTVDGETTNDEIYGSLLNVNMKVVGGEWRVYALTFADPTSGGQEECREYIEQLDLPESYSSAS